MAQNFLCLDEGLKADDKNPEQQATEKNQHRRGK